MAVAIAQTEQGNALPRLSDKSISDDQKSIGIYNPEEKVLYWLDGFCGLSGGDVRSVRWASGHIIAYDVIRFSARYYQEVAKQYAVTDKVLARSNADYGSYVGCVAQTLIYEAKSSGPDSDLSRVKSTLEAFAPADGAKILSFVKRNKSAFSRADCRIFREGGLVAGKVWRITITAGPSQAISGEEAGAPDLEMDAVYRLGMSKIALQGLSY
ncbi:MAG: hypothetical protein NTU88_09895 [Armatimonadetes bacterium]|nr:hypothetical protein [Armatimonadota bacterium]